jgi:hypothetical protein
VYIPFTCCLVLGRVGFLLPMVMVEPGFFCLTFVFGQGVGGCSVGYSTKLGCEMETRSIVDGVCDVPPLSKDSQSKPRSLRGVISK